MTAIRAGALTLARTSLSSAAAISMVDSATMATKAARIAQPIARFFGTVFPCAACYPETKTISTRRGVAVPALPFPVSLPTKSCNPMALGMVPAEP